MTDQVITTQESTEYLNKLVGEGAKYADPENLAKGYINLESHVETIKAEKAALEEKLGIKAAQDNHLETIVNMLKEPTKEEVQEKPVVTETVEPVTKPKEDVPVMSTQASLAVAQFAKDSVAKYGDADTVGKHLQKYIGGDQAKQKLVQSMMQTDPSALLRILPEKNTEFSPTGSTSGGTHQNETTLPLTWNDCLKVRKEDPLKYKSPAFVQKMMDARILAKKQGVLFENT